MSNKYLQSHVMGIFMRVINNNNNKGFSSDNNYIHDCHIILSKQMFFFTILITECLVFTHKYYKMKLTQYHGCIS